MSFLKQIRDLASTEVERFSGRLRTIQRLLQGSWPAIAVTPSEVVWTRNKLRLLRYLSPLEMRPPSRLPILIIPSLINRPYILDLQPGKSFVEYLVRLGYDVFLVDWGRPSHEDQHFSFDDHIELFLHGAVRQTLALAATTRLHLVGHCIGGMLTLIYAALHPAPIASLLNLTTPVDLKKGGILTRWTDPETMEPETLTRAFGNAPWPLLQAAFHMLTPMGTLQKTAWIYERLWDEPTVDSFLALETWANDNVSIPGAFFRTYIRELYQKNALFEQTLRIAGKPVRISQLRMPILNVAAKGDHIAPAESVLALSSLLPHAQELLMSGGHIGAVVSQKASQALWPKLHAFFQSLESPPPTNTNAP